jgi:hypothetical protein
MRGYFARVLNLFLFIGILFSCVGCATARHPVPTDMISKVQVKNMSEIRYMDGMIGSELQKNAIRSFFEEKPGDFPVDAQGRRIYPTLALSGGAANGAYGAGLLKGWSQEGTRPIFKAVTGVSTGAIIAPFVFLGKDYDWAMEELYTTMSTKDVMRMRRPLKALFGDSFASNWPLEKTLKHYYTADFLKKIADEHKKGRRLYVGTTYLDAQRFVIWDLGAIAARGDAELFCKVILASAAIPPLFSPVYINVEGSGKVYDEMHVDGGVMMQVFILYKIIQGEGEFAKSLGLDHSKVKGVCYIIRNGYVEPNFKVVNDNVLAIIGQALETIVDAQGIGDTYRIYTFMKDAGNDYNLAFIPGDFRPDKKQDFDPDQMRKLFDKGYLDAVKGYKWKKFPPGMETSH